MPADDADDEATEGGPSELATQLPGIEVRTALEGEDPETLEAVHRRQLEWALEHAEAAKEATRM